MGTCRIGSTQTKYSRLRACSLLSQPDTCTSAVHACYPVVPQLSPNALAAALEPLQRKGSSGPLANWVNIPELLICMVGRSHQRTRSYMPEAHPRPLLGKPGKHVGMHESLHWQVTARRLQILPQRQHIHPVLTHPRHHLSGANCMKVMPVTSGARRASTRAAAGPCRASKARLSNSDSTSQRPSRCCCR